MSSFFRWLGSNRWFYRLFNTGFLAINVFDVIHHWGENSWAFWLACTLAALFAVLAFMSWFVPETYTEYAEDKSAKK